MDLKVYCEYMRDPIGLDMQNPRFSWSYEGDGTGRSQRAYRILVGETEEQLERGEGTLWDSGMVESSESSCVWYQGKNLQSAKTFDIKVTALLDDGQAVESRITSFTTGLANGEPWEALWIGLLWSEAAFGTGRSLPWKSRSAMPWLLWHPHAITCLR